MHQGVDNFVFLERRAAQRFFFRSGLGAETDNLLQSTPQKIENFKKQKKNKGLFFLKTFQQLKEQGLIF